MKDIKNAQDLAEHLDAHGSDERSLSHRLYKDTACGAWLKLDAKRDAVVIGTIVEGADIEPIVSPRVLYFPFLPTLFDKVIKDIEGEASTCWTHWNECPESCDGSCGYESAVGSMEIEANHPPRSIGIVGDGFHRNGRRHQ